MSNGLAGAEGNETVTASTQIHPSPVRGRWLLATIIVSLGFVCLLALGFWQLGRLQQRRAANAQIDGPDGAAPPEP